MTEAAYMVERFCLRKANLTEEQANKIIDRALKNENLLLYYYKCPLCNSHHLTKQVPNKENRLEIA